MIDSAANRRATRREEIVRRFAVDDVEAALDLLALVDLAWHDCYGESSPPSSVVDDMLTVAEGDVRSLSRAGYRAVIDFRDLRLDADRKR